MVSSDASKSSAKGLYGDMVNMCTGLAIMPDLGWKVYQVMQAKDHPKKNVAPIIYGLWAIPALLTYIQLYSMWVLKREKKEDTNGKNNEFCLLISRLIFLSCMFLNAIMDIADWPYTGESTITKMYQAGVLVGVLANISLSFREKMIRLLAIFIAGSFVSILSPYSVYTEDTLPILGGTVLLAIFGLSYVQFNMTRGVASVLLARLLLAAIYIHHTVHVLAAINIDEGISARENIQAMLKAAVIACIGFIATGTFYEKMEHKEQLEVLIHERTSELRIQHEKLDMVNMALQATDTAITITNESGRIVWFNTAFDQMGNGEDESKEGKGKALIGRALKNVIYNIDPTQKTNKYILLEALDDIYGESDDDNDDSDDLKSKKQKEHEIQIGSSIYQVEVTPFLHNGNIDKNTNSNGNSTAGMKPNDRRVLVVFKDITETRARERAEKNAKEEALMAKAMGDSMVTLTHELRTPLQGIMGITNILLQAPELSFDAMESLKLIMASSGSLLNLINNLPEMKKKSSKILEEFPLEKKVLVLEDVDFNNLLDVKKESSKMLEEFLVEKKLPAPKDVDSDAVAKAYASDAVLLPTTIYVYKDGEWKISHNHSSDMPEINIPQKISEEQVKDLFSSWNDALATGDADALATLYSKDAVLTPPGSDTPRTGYDSIKNYFDTFLLKKPQGEILQRNILIGKNWAKDMGTYEFTMYTDGLKMKARYSFIYVFEDGQWKISQHHSSMMP